VIGASSRQADKYRQIQGIKYWCLDFPIYMFFLDGNIHTFPRGCDVGRNLHKFIKCPPNFCTSAERRRQIGKNLNSNLKDCSLTCCKQCLSRLTEVGQHIQPLPPCTMLSPKKNNPSHKYSIFSFLQWLNVNLFNFLITSLCTVTVIHLCFERITNGD
jgi:hypothetical protein